MKLRKGEVQKDEVQERLSGRSKKVNLKKSKMQKGEVQEKVECKKSCEKAGKEVYALNTHWSACGTVRIKVAYGKVPLRAGWARGVCKGEVPFR